MPYAMERLSTLEAAAAKDGRAASTTERRRTDSGTRREHGRKSGGRGGGKEPRRPFRRFLDARGGATRAEIEARCERIAKISSRASGAQSV